MQRLFSALAAFLRWWQHEYISVKVAATYILLLSAVFFLLGGIRPQSDYRQLENKLADTRAEMRLFANEMARRNSLLNNMRARDNLNKKTIELLNGKLDILEDRSLHWQERTAFYRHVLENQTPGSDLLIHALAASPDFSRRGWQLSAILARPGKRTLFKGSYYFEIVEANPDGTHTLSRLPPEGEHAFSMDFYHEIKQLVNVAADKTIENLRLIILDEKGNSIASDETVGKPDNGEPSEALVNES